VRGAGFSYDQSKRIVKQALECAGCSNPAAVRELHNQIAIDQFKSGVSASDCRKRLVRDAGCSYDQSKLIIKQALSLAPASSGNRWLIRRTSLSFLSFPFLPSLPFLPFLPFFPSFPLSSYLHSSLLLGFFAGLIFFEADVRHVRRPRWPLRWTLRGRRTSLFWCRRVLHVENLIDVRGRRASLFWCKRLLRIEKLIDVGPSGVPFTLRWLLHLPLRR